MITNEDDFFGPRAIPLTEQVGGLVVGQRARVIWNEKGEVVWDELRVLERDYARSASPPILFVTADGDWEEDRRFPDAQAAKWKAIMKLDRLPSVAEADEYVRRWNAPSK